jgi:hypothetical protein
MRPTWRCHDRTITASAKLCVRLPSNGVDLRRTQRLAPPIGPCPRCVCYIIPEIPCILPASKEFGFQRRVRSSPAHSSGGLEYSRRFRGLDAVENVHVSRLRVSPIAAHLCPTLPDATAVAVSPGQRPNSNAAETRCLACILRGIVSFTPAGRQSAGLTDGRFVPQGRRRQIDRSAPLRSRLPTPDN